MEQQKKTPKYSLWSIRKYLKASTIVIQVLLHIFALAGIALLGAWALYQTGITNDAGSVDKNARQIANYSARINTEDSAAVAKLRMQNYIDIAVLNKLYPTNAQIIFKAASFSNCPDGVDRMTYALSTYMNEDGQLELYHNMMEDVYGTFNKYKVKPYRDNLIPWMNCDGWESLKLALAADSKAVKEAAKLTGVDARLIVACTVGEQVRLLNSKRESLKKALGPATMLVNSQFSFGVNGIKDFTAVQVEQNLKSSKSKFYMGKEYEHILDFQTEDIENERIGRLVDSTTHLYSYIYTGCILHQTMLQWKRAGFDISDRPDILFTLFNLGFNYSRPHAEPQCGGANISVDGRVYTFGALANDFFYSGELGEEYPLPAHNFKE